MAKWLSLFLVTTHGENQLCGLAKLLLAIGLETLSCYQIHMQKIAIYKLLSYPKISLIKTKRRDHKISIRSYSYNIYNHWQLCRYLPTIKIF